MSSMHGRPTSDELLEAVKEWLERDVAGIGDPRIAFHTRVAVNIIEMVRREHHGAERTNEIHDEMLSLLDVDDEADLVSRIRAGAHDESMATLLAALRPVIEDKVRVANPGYLD